MAWYKEGTCSVVNGSPIVTGVITPMGDDESVQPYWVANASAGSIFRGPDRQIYEILSVNSDLQLTLAEPYLGTTANDQLYAIAPTQSFVKELADQVTNMVSDYAGLLPYDPDGVYPDGSIQDTIQQLQEDDRESLPTANQIAIAANDDDTGLIYSLPAVLIAPGSVQATGKLSGLGTATNDNATAGQIGEFMIDTVAAPGVALTTVTNTDVSVAITLTPGDWMVGGGIAFTGNATAVVYAGGWVGNSSASVTANRAVNWLGRSANLPVDIGFAVPTRRFQVAAGQTAVLHLVAKASFSGGTLSAYGEVWARRMR
jgi:hypothetical protein